MEETLKILIIEDSPADFLLVERHLRQEGMSVRCVRVDTTEAIEQALDEGGWDLILSDYSVPRLSFQDSFARIQSRTPDLPVILVSGSVGEMQAVELLKLGVRDFILKDNLTRLVPAVQRALKENQELAEHRQAKAALAAERTLLRTLINTIPDLVWLKDPDCVYLTCNPEFERLYGVCEADIIGKTDYDYVDRELADLFRKNDCKAMAAGAPTANEEWLTYASDGHIALFETIKTPMFDPMGHLTGVLGIARDITGIKQTENALLESEKMYRSLFENMMNGFAYCRMIFDGDSPCDFIYLSVNEAFEKQTGLKDVVGRRVSEVIPGIRESDPGIFEVYGRVAITGNPEQFEVYVEAMNEWFWVSVYSPAREHFVAVFDVIGERKRNEVEREATLELLRICNKADRLPELMQELMSYFKKITGCEGIGVRLHDGDDYPYYETRGFADDFVLAEKSLCSYDQQGELIRDYAGHPALDCMCGNILCNRVDPSKPFFTSHGSFWSNCTTELLASTTDADRQTKTRNRCNGEGFESVALIPLRYHNETFGLLQFNDRRKGRFTPEIIDLYENLADYISVALSKMKSDEALRESEQFNLQVINNAEEGIVVYGPDMRYRGWNPYMERLSGLSAQDVIGKHPLELFPFLKDGGVIERLEKVLNGQTVVSIEFPFHNPHNGLTGWASDTLSPLKDFSGELIGAIGVVRDITARKLSDLELQKKNADIKQFLYSVSHDLRSPLVTIKTFTGYLEIDMTGSDQERTSQDIHFIHSAADKMKLLLDELLEMSRIDRVDAQPVRVSLMGLLDGVLDTLAGVISDRKVDIHLPDKDLMLLGDYPRLCQIWQNLIENAIKYSCNGSTPLIELGIQELNGDTAFFVKDNGIGIDPHYHNKIFGMFEKLNPKSPGAGLGLSMVKRIVEKYRGRVWVESEGIGEGSCFYFTLPQAVVQS